MAPRKSQKKRPRKAEEMLDGEDLNQHTGEIAFKTLCVHAVVLDLGARDDRCRIVEIGVFYEDVTDPRPEGEFLRLYSLVIRPKAFRDVDWRIFNVKKIERRAGDHVSHRLSWEWQGSTTHWPAGLPWSDTTGPFSFFTIFIGGENTGRAYSLEFPIIAKDIEHWTAGSEECIDVVVTGQIFGGKSIASDTFFFLKHDLFPK